MCWNSYIFTFPSKKIRPFNTFVFSQTENSYNYNYLMIRAMEFFGFICESLEKCSVEDSYCSHYKETNRYSYICLTIISIINK